MPIQVEGADPVSGGLVSGLPPHLVGAAESPDCSNTDPAEPWGMSTRMGSAVFGSAIGGPTLNSGQLSTGDIYMAPDIELALVRGASVIYFANNTGGWGSAVGLGAGVSPTLMGAAWLRGTQASAFFSTATIPAFIVTNASTPSFFNTTTGSVIAASMASAGVKYGLVKLYANRLFVCSRADDPRYRNWVAHSALNDSSDWTSAGNAGGFPLGDSAPFVGMEPTKVGLYFFKPNSVWLLSGTEPADFTVSLVTDQIGCVSFWGHCTDGNGAYFAADDGIYYVSGLNVTRISDKIRKDYIDIPDKRGISLEFVGEKLYCYMNPTTAAANNAAFVAAPRRRMETGEQQPFWAKWPSQTYGAADLCLFTGSIYAVTVSSSLQIFKIETGSGAGLTMYYNTPDMDWGYPEFQKQLTRWTAHIRPTSATQTWTAQPFCDGVSTGSVYSFDVDPSSGSHAYITRIGRPDLSGRYMRLKFSTTGQGMLYGYGAYAEVQGDGDLPRRSD